jgi:lysophospholipase L1-like esterase
MQLRTYGPSSAFGWGVESAETYTALVAHLLPITTKNFSQIGFSSEQGKLLLDQDPPQHAVLIFAYGINDLDRFRFYFPSASPDSEFFHHPVPRAEFLMSELSTYWHSFRYLNRFAALLRGRMDCRFPKEMPRRVSNEEFLKNIGVFAQAAKQSQSQLIAIDTPYWPAELNSAPKNDSNYSQVLAASARGDCSEARALFQTFLGTETDRIIQDQRKLNSALASWAKENKVPLVQASQLLATQEDFVDPIHPSVLGHAKIAAEIAKLIVHKE